MDGPNGWLLLPRWRKAKPLSLAHPSPNPASSLHAQAAVIERRASGANALCLPDARILSHHPPPRPPPHATSKTPAMAQPRDPSARPPRGLHRVQPRESIIDPDALAGQLRYAPEVLQRVRLSVWCGVCVMAVSPLTPLVPIPRSQKSSSTAQCRPLSCRSK